MHFRFIIWTFLKCCFYQFNLFKKLLISKIMKTINKNTFDETQSIDLTIGTFTVSTLFFILYILSNESSNVLVAASPFVVSAIMLNAIMLFHLTDNFIRLSGQRKDIAVKILTLLSNIPITLLYYFLVT